MIFVTKSELPPIEDYMAGLREIWGSAVLTNNGPYLLKLEKELSAKLEVPHISLLNNGTTAIQFALRALELTGEVITTPYTFAATTNVIFWEGLTPVFADIDPDTFNIDPDDIERKITGKTSAILAVHVYGNPCEVEKIERIAKKHNLKVIYDAAHAFGVKIKGKSVFEYGDLNTLSFHATKVFNTIEGGAVTMRETALYERINLFRNFGITSEEHDIYPGVNGKMNEFQALMGVCNLKYLDQKLEKRKKIYETYASGFDGISGIKLQKIVASLYNFAYMPVVFDSRKIRDHIHDELVKNGVKPRKYFYPLTSNLDYTNKISRSECRTPVAEKIADGVLCLPMYSSLKLEEVRKIVGIVISSL